MVGEAVQQSAGEAFRLEDLGPLVEGEVGGDQDGAPLAALAEDLEEQFRPGGGQGDEAHSSTMSRLRREICRCRLSSRLSSRASISSWTRAAAVNPTDIPRWQAAKPSPRATWVLPEPLAPTAMTFSPPLDAFAADQFHDKGLVHRGDGHKVEGVQGLDGGEAGAAARVAMFQLTAVAASASSDGFVRVLPHIFCGPPSRRNRPTLLEALDRQVGHDAEMV